MTKKQNFNFVLAIFLIVGFVVFGVAVIDFIAKDGSGSRFCDPNQYGYQNNQTAAVACDMSKITRENIIADCISKGYTSGYFSCVDDVGYTCYKYYANRTLLKHDCFKLEELLKP